MHEKNSRAAFYFALLRKNRAIHSSAAAPFQSACFGTLRAVPIPAAKKSLKNKNTSLFNS